MSQNHYHKGTAGKPRSGLIGNAEFELNPTLVTPLGAALVGDGAFTFGTAISPGVTFPQINAEGTQVVDNYDVLSANLQGRAAPIQNVGNQAEVAWFLDNIGGGTECCDASGGSAAEYTTLLSGLSYEIPRTVHGIAGFPSVTVLDPSGAEVSVCVEYIGESIFITSNVLLDTHTAILR